MSGLYNSAVGVVGQAVPGQAAPIAGSDGTNLRLISTDTTGKVNAVVSGTISANQSGTWNIATVTAVTAITNALPAGTNVIGHVIVDSGSITATAGTQFADNAASGSTPIGTLSMGWDSSNSKVRALKVDASQNLNVNIAASSLTDAAEVVAGTTASTKILIVGGKSNDGTPQYKELPLGASARSVIIEGFSGGTAVPVSVTTSSTTGNAPAAATVGVASATAVATNASRKGLILTNTSSNTISLGFGSNAAVLNSGITLVPNSVFVMDAFTFSTQAITAIASAASSNLAIQEMQ